MRSRRTRLSCRVAAVRAHLVHPSRHVHLVWNTFRVLAFSGCFRLISDYVTFISMYPARRLCWYVLRPSVPLSILKRGLQRRQSRSLWSKIHVDDTTRLTKLIKSPKGSLPEVRQTSRPAELPTAYSFRRMPMYPNHLTANAARPPAAAPEPVDRFLPLLAANDSSRFSLSWSYRLL